MEPKKKKKKTGWRKRKKERTRSAKKARKRDGERRWKWRWSEAVAGLRDTGRGVVFTAGRSVARETVSRAQIVSSLPKGRYTVHSKIS